VKPVAANVTTAPLLTVGQCVPLTDGAPGSLYRFVGIPDGLGAFRAKGDPKGLLTVLVNHEFGISAGAPAGPLPSGARVSEVLLDVHKGGKKAGASVVSARPFIQAVYAWDGGLQDWVAQVPGTRRIARLCSAFMADGDVGFDRPVFLHGEETSTVGAGQSFDGLGGKAFATFADATYDLPWLGHMSWENVVVANGTGRSTVVFCLEDGPSSGDGMNSQLYMYLGTKNPWSDDPLEANGLVGGKLYAFATDDPAQVSEATLTTKGDGVSGHWVQVSAGGDANTQDAATKALGAFGFVRIEDGCSDPRHPGVFWFDTTGANGNVANPLGRIYRLLFDAKAPLLGATLELVLDGSEGIVSPDNMGINKHGELMIQEDPNPPLGGRDSSIWAYDTQDGSLTRLAQIDRATAKAHALAADAGNSLPAGNDFDGSWESSGIIDAEAWFGRGAWLLDVQAHGLRIVPTAETVEGGQLLLMTWKRTGKGK
jgi:hypothetical protein